jgi:hypothetical protein
MAKKHPPSRLRHNRPSGGRKIRILSQIALSMPKPRANSARVPWLESPASGATKLERHQRSRKMISARARTFAAEKGLRYQTYLKMLLHQALNSEEKKEGRRQPRANFYIAKWLSASHPYHRNAQTLARQL